MASSARAQQNPNVAGVEREFRNFRNLLSELAQRAPRFESASLSVLPPSTAASTASVAVIPTAAAERTEATRTESKPKCSSPVLKRQRVPSPTSTTSVDARLKKARSAYNDAKKRFVAINGSEAWAAKPKKEDDETEIDYFDRVVHFANRKTAEEEETKTATPTGTAKEKERSKAVPTIAPGTVIKTMTKRQLAMVKQSAACADNVAQVAVKEAPPPRKPLARAPDEKSSKPKKPRAKNENVPSSPAKEKKRPPAPPLGDNATLTNAEKAQVEPNKLIQLEHCRHTLQMLISQSEKRIKVKEPETAKDTSPSDRVEQLIGWHRKITKRIRAYIDAEKSKKEDGVAQLDGTSRDDSGKQPSKRVRPANAV